MRKFVTFALAIAATPLFGQSGFKQQLSEFIQSVPPIGEMVVECNWYAHAVGKTNITWVALCWQTNAYILRTSRERVGLYDTFDTNRDELITIRAGDTYSTVSWYKNLGIHIKRVQGTSSSPWVKSSEKTLDEYSTERDRMMPQIRGQEVAVEQALGVGLAAPPGAIVFKKGAFTYRDEKEGTTLSGAMEPGLGNVPGITLTNVVDATADRERQVVPMRIRYEYGGAAQPAWFPHVIEREVVIRGKRLTICRFVIHRLDLGVVPQSEFYPDRFLKR